MAIGDQAGLLAVKELNEKTIPLLVEALNKLILDLHQLIDRLNEATATVTIKIPERQQ